MSTNPTAIPDASQSSGSARTRQQPVQEVLGTSLATAASERFAPRTSSTSNSVNPTPLSSRDSSPIRPPPRTSTSRSAIAASRSRKNSQTDSSPVRASSRSQIPQAGAPRTLSSTTTPSLPPTPTIQDPNIKSPVPQKHSRPEQVHENGPRWPVSPRLRSPPPNLNKTTAINRRLEGDAPALSLQRATPSPGPPEAQQMSESETEEIQLQSGIRTPARSSTLETVQEISLPGSPQLSTDAAMEKVTEKLASELAHRNEAVRESRTLRARPAASTAESGSEGGSLATDARRTSTTGPQAPPLMSRQSSAMSAKPGKAKTSAEGSTQNMTVETETVAAVPSVAVALPNTQGSNANTLKAKPSTETIKPKKEKKKTARKQPAVSTGTASSKAEIFEAKVASAVDENDDSDSEETFVYDSNPPDGPRRFHSRTPSATSMMSQADRAAMRSIHGVMETAGPPVSIKKHTKFANTAGTAGGDSTTGDEDGRGTGRSNAASSRGAARQHHHIGRWPRNGGHPSLFDSDSPFPTAQRHKMSTANSRNSSRPTSPRNGSGRTTNGKRPPMAMANSYDLDDTTGADDERTPLIPASMRSSRATRSRRAPMSHGQLEGQSFRSRSSYLNRFAACLVITMMLLVFITGAIGFMFATSQPLTNIELTQIKSVIASEPELMFDVTVRAHNPNIVVVTIDDANLEIFAKSIHAGSDQEWRDNPHGPPDNVQPGSPVLRPGPIKISEEAGSPDDDAAPNMRLGTITVFDSPLTFEGSFFHKGMSSSTGSLRLALPGNSTSGGTERWGRIIQDEFDLIVKGIVKYNLPLSQKVRSASISGRTTVKPNSASDPSLRPNATTIRTTPSK